MGNAHIKKEIFANNIKLMQELNALNNNCTTCSNFGGFNACSQPYALCTSAKCKKTSYDPNMSVCSCPIESGCSLGTQECSTLAPYSESGINYIYSTFNPSQLTQPGMAILPYNEPNRPWANCLNQKCIVDPTNSSNALCYCPLTTSNTWTAFGSRYIKDPNIYLSASTPAAEKVANSYMESCNGVNFLS